MSGILARPSRGTILLVDLAVASWIVAWTALGLVVAREVEAMTELSTTVEVAAGAIEQTGDVLRTVGNVPFVGGRVTELAERIQETGTSARLGAAESRESVRTLSRLLGASVVLLASLPLLALYLPLRLVWRRELSSVRRALARDPGSPALREFLARRAAATLPYEQLRRVSENPWRDLEQGRFDALAEAELSRLGLRRRGGR